MLFLTHKWCQVWMRRGLWPLHFQLQEASVNMLYHFHQLFLQTCDSKYVSCFILKLSLKLSTPVLASSPLRLQVSVLPNCPFPHPASQFYLTCSLTVAIRDMIQLFMPINIWSIVNYICICTLIKKGTAIPTHSPIKLHCIVVASINLDCKEYVISYYLYS